MSRGLEPTGKRRHLQIGAMDFSLIYTSGASHKGCGLFLLSCQPVSPQKLHCGRLFGLEQMKHQVSLVALDYQQERGRMVLSV